MLRLASVSETFFWGGGTPPSEEAECLLRLLSFLEEGERAQQRGGGVHSPPLTHKFASALLSSPPKQVGDIHQSREG